MKRYLNIFHQEDYVECYLIDESGIEKTEKMKSGNLLMIEERSGDKTRKAILCFDIERGEYYLDIEGKKRYDVQGMSVV